MYSSPAAQWVQIPLSLSQLRPNNCELLTFFGGSIPRLHLSVFQVELFVAINELRALYCFQKLSILPVCANFLSISIYISLSLYLIWTIYIKFSESAMQTIMKLFYFAHVFCCCSLEFCLFWRALENIFVDLILIIYVSLQYDYDYRQVLDLILNSKTVYYYKNTFYFVCVLKINWVNVKTYIIYNI